MTKLDKHLYHVFSLGKFFP